MHEKGGGDGFDRAPDRSAPDEGGGSGLPIAPCPREVAVEHTKPMCAPMGEDHSRGDAAVAGLDGLAGLRRLEDPGAEAEPYARVSDIASASGPQRVARRCTAVRSTAASIPKEQEKL